ncbi:MAG: class I SAM-dependent methyltransferase [Vulcanimicrobiaceae bacterium]
MAQHVKLHLGCGKRYIPGFVHVDSVPAPHVDHVGDIRTLPQFSDGSAALIYACQVIEYFDREEVVAVLKEWRRVLAPGGILRLSVPNFEVISRLYVAGLELQWFLGTLYGKIGDGHGGYQYHRTTYDEPSLRKLLAHTGFVDAELWRWQDVEHCDVDDFSQAYFPHMEKERGILWNLNMQARRPA